MGTIEWNARPMATFPVDGQSISTPLDVLDSTYVSLLVDVAVLPEDGSELVVNGQHSIDGQFWESIGGLSILASSAGAHTAVATVPVLRYVRLAYELNAASAPVTFTATVFVKTRARG